LKPERWGSQLVEEEKHQGEKDCDRRFIIIIIIIITIIIFYKWEDLITQREILSK
jgi:hypothetical protein